MDPSYSVKNNKVIDCYLGNRRQLLPPFHDIRDQTLLPFHSDRAYWDATDSPAGQHWICPVAPLPLRGFFIWRELKALWQPLCGRSIPFKFPQSPRAGLFLGHNW